MKLFIAVGWRDGMNISIGLQDLKKSIMDPPTTVPHYVKLHLLHLLHQTPPITPSEPNHTKLRYCTKLYLLHKTTKNKR